MGDPIRRFRDLFERARAKETSDATAMALATADAAGRPAVRIVLLKAFDERGFVFYTNLESRKARELAVRPEAALCIHWPVLAVQVRAEGRTEPASAAEADAYFASRPRKSQLGAWASKQSAPLPARAWLLARFFRYAAHFTGRDVPRPPYWGGYRLVPDRIEFWYNQDFRLHDRILYTRTEEGWSEERLYP
jgi:pyridoxamine 5'-phosphate oxidase